MLTTIFFFARQYKSSAFAQQLLDILRILRVPSWSQKSAPHPVPCIRKVSGALTNAVFFVSSPSTSSRTLLLRVYGPSSGSLISRPRELHVLHVLSSRSKRLGPRIYGTFTNGRLEEYFDSVTLTATDIREPRISAYIGTRMAELHSVDVTTIEGQSHGSNIEFGVQRNVRSWLPHARGVLALPAITPAICKELDLDKFQTRWGSYMKWLRKTAHLDAHPVFCHNDAQYGNILRLNRVEESTPEHHQVRPSFVFPFLPTLRGSDGSLTCVLCDDRSSLSTLSTLPRTQPPSTSRTTSTSGRSITTDRLHTSSTSHATRATPSGAPSSPPTLRTAPRRRLDPSTPPPFRICPPPRASVSSSRSRMPCARGAPRHTPCGRCGASSRRTRTFRRTSPSPSLTMSATLAAA